MGTLSVSCHCCCCLVLGGCVGVCLLPAVRRACLALLHLFSAAFDAALDCCDAGLLLQVTGGGGVFTAAAAAAAGLSLLTAAGLCLLLMQCAIAAVLSLLTAAGLFLLLTQCAVAALAATVLQATHSCVCAPRGVPRAVLCCSVPCAGAAWPRLRQRPPADACTGRVQRGQPRHTHRPAALLPR